jgi:hypothetical protein
MTDLHRLPGAGAAERREALFSQARSAVEAAKARGEGSVTVMLDTRDADRFEAAVSQFGKAGVTVKPTSGTEYGWTSPFLLTWEQENALGPAERDALQKIASLSVTERTSTTPNRLDVTLENGVRFAVEIPGRCGTGLHHSHRFPVWRARRKRSEGCTRP